ncbi:MAG: hypothetical protein MUC56_08275 [Thermoanaerobaculales bacterium]|jgi:hypothetical protein|nr:hypothetical protein [Thermoanaerobaculales bacterium]
MTRPDVITQRSRLDDRNTQAGRRGDPARGAYEPPRVERCTRLDRAVQFGGGSIVDSGAGLGRQAGSAPPGSRPRS